MAKKLIKIKDLVPGMYIEEISCSGQKERERIGETHNFLVISKSEIDRLEELGVRELYINTARGLDHIDEDEERRKTNQAIIELARLRNPGSEKPKSLADELYAAKMLLVKTRTELENAIANLRRGIKIDVTPFWPLLEEIYESVSENKDAIVTVCRKKSKGGYALEHSVSHCALMMAFAQTMEMDKEAVLEVGLGGLFHDIGKVRVPAAILNKPGKLTPEELSVARQHAAWGGDLVKRTEGFPEKAVAVVMEHHERLDGTGYPNQLKEHEISLFGQMGSIVDVYDACISIRAYGAAVDPCLVIRQLFEGAGKQFHKELVQQFIKTIGIFPVGTLAKLESNKLAIVIRQTKSLTQPLVRVVYDLKQNCFIPPEDVDLSRPRPKMDKVVGHEAPEKWNIDPFRYISPEMAA